MYRKVLLPTNQAAASPPGHFLPMPTAIGEAIDLDGRRFLDARVLSVFWGRFLENDEAIVFLDDLMATESHQPQPLRELLNATAFFVHVGCHDDLRLLSCGNFARYLPSSAAATI